MPTFLMCPPDHFGIEYEINPWMDRRRAANPSAARRQWRALHDLLTGGLGATVELIEPVKGLPDLVFTANAGLVSGRDYIAPNFRHAERRPERPVFERWFRSRGYKVHALPEGDCFEGEGDALPLGETWFAGYRIRSDIGAHRRVGEILGREVLSLELADPRFYHLDTCFCPLGEREALYYPPAFDDYGRKVIREFVPEAIPVGESDALRLGCNAVVIGRDVILQEGCAALNDSLERRGYRVHPVDLSEFHKAGGSAKCLVLTIASGRDAAGHESGPDIVNRAEEAA